MIAQLATAILTAATLYGSPPHSNGMPTTPPAAVSLPFAIAPGLARGRALYAEHCASCHGADYRGTPNGPPLAQSGAAGIDFMLATGRMPLNVPGAESLRQPVHFTSAEIRDIVDAIVADRGTQGPAIPAIVPGHDIVRGRALFSTNCEQCHGATAFGAVIGYGWLAPSILPDAPTQIAEAIRLGPGEMPPFPAALLSDRDVGDIMGYVESLPRAPNPGGFPLTSVGPVGEGLVGVIVGVGLPVLVMLAVGTRLHPGEEG